MEKPELPPYENLPPHLKQHVEFLAVAMAGGIVKRANTLADMIACEAMKTAMDDEAVGEIRIGKALSTPDDFKE